MEDACGSRDYWEAGGAAIEKVKKLRVLRSEQELSGGSRVGPKVPLRPEATVSSEHKQLTPNSGPMLFLANESEEYLETLFLL